MQANGRIDWLDCARGGTILLVVLWHSYLAAASLGDVHLLVDRLNNALASVRMPLFFFCSGMLAAKGLRKSWPDLLRGRIGIMLWVYAVWTSITFAVDLFAPLYPWRDHDQHAADLFWLPHGNQWFIYALLLLTIYAKSIRSWTVPAQIAVTAMAVAGLGLWYQASAGGIFADSVLKPLALYALAFFMAGFWLARPVGSLDLRRTAWATVLGGAILWLGCKIAILQGMPVPLGVLAVPGVATAIALAVLLRELTAVADILRWLGSRTLEIFVSHQFFVAAGFVVARAMDIAPTIAVPAITVLAVIGSTSFALAVQTPRMRILLRPPSRFGFRRPAQAG